MKLALLAATATATIVYNVGAQALRVQVRNGDVYIQDGAGLSRLTHDGRNTEPTSSRDGTLIAFIHKDGMEDSEELNSIFLCIASTRHCERILSPQSANEPKSNLTGINSLQFSYQAGIGSSGDLIGSLFFQTNAWATSGAVHRATFGPNPGVTFVTDANGYSVVPNGKFAGALEVTRHVYSKSGAGSCEQTSIMDPNTGKRLTLLPSPDCQGMTVD